MNQYRPTPCATTLAACSRVGKIYVVTDTIAFTLHKDKPNYRSSMYVRALCNIGPQKTDTHRTRLTVGGNLINNPIEVGTPTSDLSIMKLHINSSTSDVRSRYMCMDIKCFLPE